MWKREENQQIHISETTIATNVKDLPGQKFKVKDEPHNWSESEDTHPVGMSDDLDFSFPLATSLMDSLNSSPPAPFTLPTLDELAHWPSTSSQPLKAATLPRRGSMTWPQVSSCEIFSWYQFHLLVSSVSNSLQYMAMCHNWCATLNISSQNSQQYHTVQKQSYDGAYQHASPGSPFSN